jgi:hypothetical protein
MEVRTLYMVAAMAFIMAVVMGVTGVEGAFALLIVAFITTCTGLILEKVHGLW